MKKIASLLLLLLGFLLISCEGDQGPPGPPGEPGSIFVAETIQVNANFNAGNEYRERFFLEPNIQDDDVVLVYRREAVDNQLSVWEQLPTASFFFFNDEGVIEGYLNYRFNFTVGDVDIIMDSDAPDQAGPEFTDNQTFRIVIIPSEQAANSDVDFSNFNEVQKKFLK